MVILAAVAFVAALSDGLATADDSGVQAVSYSTGRSGSKLKWLSQQPAVPKTATVESASSPLSATPSPLRTAQNQKPAAEKSDAESLQEMPVEMKPDKPADLAPLESLKPKPSDLQPLPLSKDFDREMESRQHEFKEECPSPKDLKPIAKLTTNIKPSEGDLPHDCPLGNATFQSRSFAPITYTWTASGLCHKPLYFEDVQLERYGHMCGPWVQPFASGAHFFATIPILPYKMGLELPNECMYTLGYYRPGDCAPYLFDPLPLSVRGALFEAGAWVGGVFIFP